MEELHNSENEFPGLYASETSYRSDSDYNDSSLEKGGKRDLLRSKKKEKGKDKGYAALDAESSEGEMDHIDIKNPLKSKRPKSFKFLQKKDKEEREDKKKDEKDEKKKEKKKKEEKKLKQKEEKKKRQKEKKKKGNDDEDNVEDCTIFGVPLSIAVDRNLSHDGIRLPAIVRECIDFVEEKGLNCEGIYRIGGVKSKVQCLKRAYDAGEIVNLNDQHPHIVASLLKQYLRELPETILTVDMMPHFEDVSLIPNPRERAEAMRQLIDRLPTTNRLLLQYVLKHMGHVIEREKDTKMSYHNVCVILSPTMQISHRVLNVMFHSHQFLFGNVQIKKYLPPITSFSSAKRSVEDLKTTIDIEEEIMKQESLLSSLHSAIAAGRISRNREEQLWEAQRILTLLKRKHKSLHRKECDDLSKNCSYTCSEKEFPSHKGKETESVISDETEKDEDVNVPSLTEVKSGSETDSNSIKVVSKEETPSRKSSDGESDQSEQISSQSKREIAPQSEGAKCQVIPILPKPISVRSERKASRDKSLVSDCRSSKTKREPFVVKQPQGERLEGLKSTSDAAGENDWPKNYSLPRAFPSSAREKTVHQNLSNVPQVLQTEGTRGLSTPRKSSVVTQGKKAEPVEAYKNKFEAILNRLEKDGVVFTEEADFSLVEQELCHQSLLHQELTSLTNELKRRLQFEKTEIFRLQEEIQELQTLYGYRTHSYDSSESERSESEGESDNEEEITKDLMVLNKANKGIKSDNVSLTKQIQSEREVILQLKVALKLMQIDNKFPHEMIQFSH